MQTQTTTQQPQTTRTPYRTPKLVHFGQLAAAVQAQLS